MGQGNMIGYEITEKMCQISYYNDQQSEPETLEVDSDNYQIPLLIGRLRDTWAYGKEAKRLVTIKEGFVVTRLLERSLAGEKIDCGEETYDAVELLSKFIQLSLQQFPVIDGIVFSVPELTEELAQIGLPGTRAAKGLMEELKKRIPDADFTAKPAKERE